MPVYEYRCASCDQEFEEFLFAGETDDDVTCPACGERRAERRLSAFAVQGGQGSGGTGSAAGSSCGPSGFG